MWSFLKHQLDPATRLGELLFGLIMALGIMLSVQIGVEEATNREMLIAVLGCNVAWGIVDGVMFVLVSLFERSRKTRVVQSVLSSPSDKVALERIHHELGDRLELLTTDQDREQLYQAVLAIVRRSNLGPPTVHRDDILGGTAVGLLIFVATLPIVLPFAVITNPVMALRIAVAITLTMQFLTGFRWGQLVGVNPWRIGAGVTAVGVTLVLITIAFGA